MLWRARLPHLHSLGFCNVESLICCSCNTVISSANCLFLMFNCKKECQIPILFDLGIQGLWIQMFSILVSAFEDQSFRNQHLLVWIARITCLCNLVCEYEQGNKHMCSSIPLQLIPYVILPFTERVLITGCHTVESCGSLKSSLLNIKISFAVC